MALLTIVLEAGVYAVVGAFVLGLFGWIDPENITLGDVIVSCAVGWIVGWGGLLLLGNGLHKWDTRNSPSDPKEAGAGERRV